MQCVLVNIFACELCCSYDTNLYPPLYNCSTPGFPVLCLSEFTKTRVLWVRDAIQASHSLLSSSLLLSIFPIIRVFSMSQFFSSGGQSIGASTSASVLPVNIQDWFPLGMTGLISFLSKRFSGFIMKDILKCLDNHYSKQYWLEEYFITGHFVEDVTAYWVN